MTSSATSNSKVWFITGISKGIGLEIAKAALASGHTVIGTVRSGNVPADVKSSKLHIIKLDVSDEAAVQAAAKQAIQFGNGRVDVVVNNAGFLTEGAIEEISLKQVKKQYDTNVYGVISVIHAFLPLLRQQRSGHIINITSAFGRVTAPGYGVYASSKYAVEALSEALSAEVKSFGIHVTIVEPGWTRTPILDATTYGDQPLHDVYGGIRHGQQEVEAISGKQPGDPARQGKAVVDIASLSAPPLHLPFGKDAYGYITGGLGAILSEIEKTKHISYGTDFPPEQEEKLAA